MISKYINDWLDIIENMNNDNTYKLAWGRALLECISFDKCYEENGMKVFIKFEDIAEYMIKYYWNQMFFFNLIALFLFYLVPYFVFMGLNSNLEIGPLEVVVSSAFILIIGNFVPIPGGSGGIEYGFLQFFGSFASGAFVSSALIIWRFVTYYLGIIIGGISLGFFKGDENKT